MGAILSNNKWVRKKYLITCQAKNVKESLAMLCRDHDAIMDYKVRATITQDGDKVFVDIYTKKKEQQVAILRELKLFCRSLYLPEVTSLDVFRRTPKRIDLPDVLSYEEDISYVYPDVLTDEEHISHVYEHQEARATLHSPVLSSNYSFEFRFADSTCRVRLAESRNFPSMKHFLQLIVNCTGDQDNKYRIQSITETELVPFECIGQMDGLLHQWQNSSPKKNKLAVFIVHLITEKPQTIQCLWLDHRTNALRY